MYETQVTVVGNLATEVDRRQLGDGTAVANFRVGSTERRYDRATGGWVDGERLYVDVKCWRLLADNAEASLVKGDPVVITGKLYTRSYEHEGQRRMAVTVEAQSVAADLARCRVVLTRTRRGAAATADDGGGEGQGTVATVPESGQDTQEVTPDLVGAAPAAQA